ncbi:PAS domain-containing sensor histidine kinase [Granulicella sp. L46]|uniref:sensor histidine kinase n=1 Tax=Granulicella sp. L46 TaxID=1641865 RepID=UPI00131D59C1|nr:PAS domain-containing sensor histidine kinase [Granulicella sp. L46]
MSSGVSDPNKIFPPLPNSENPVNVERWLAAIVESSDDAILGMALSGVITSWNAAATRIFGYEPHEALGQPVSLLAWPGEEERIDLFLAILRHGGRVDHTEVSRKHKNGKKILVALSLSPIVDSNGTIIGIAKIARDITERTEAASALEDSRIRLAEQQANARAEMLAERKFRELIENAPDAILQVDQAGAIVIANCTAEKMFCYTREELIGLNVDQLVPEANRAAHPTHRKTLATAGKSRPMGLGLDLFAQRKDGTQFPVEISLSPMNTEAGVHVTAVIRDVTDRKLTEQRVRSLQESYMTELQARHKEAERLNQLKSEFMASISHELRTPLHTIIGFAELMQEEGEGPLNSRQRRFMEHIHVDSEHLLGLINDVLDLSRIEAGGLQLHTEPVRLILIVAESIAAIRLYAESRSVSIRMGSEIDFNVLADPMRLRQILYNLLSNGAKFTQPGGEVHVEAAVEGNNVRITVSDTGLGIAPEERTQIFEKFYQVGLTPVGVREGTGLGLAICKQLVEMQKGTIWVESELGKGSKFHFTLPHNQT